jgi:hypothetical protein
MTEEQLLAHAARCNRLADLCLDPAVAKKLRALAQDYEQFIRQASGRLARPAAPDSATDSQQEPEQAGATPLSPGLRPCA